MAADQVQVRRQSALAGVARRLRPKLRRCCMATRSSAPGSTRASRSTYRALDAAADRLAARLVGIGVRKGTHVAVMLPNHPAFPVSWIALGRIGAVMVPVNTVLYRRGGVVRRQRQRCAVHHRRPRHSSAIVRTCRAGRRSSRMPTSWSTARAARRTCGAGRRWSARVPCPSRRRTRRGARRSAESAIHLGHNGVPQGLHADPRLLGHARLQRRLFRAQGRGGEERPIWAPFFDMDPMWQFLLAITRAGQPSSHDA